MAEEKVYEPKELRRRLLYRLRHRWKVPEDVIKEVEKEFSKVITKPMTLTEAYKVLVERVPKLWEFLPEVTRKKIGEISKEVIKAEEEKTKSLIRLMLESEDKDLVKPALVELLKKALAGDEVAMDKLSQAGMTVKEFVEELILRGFITRSEYERILREAVKPPKPPKKPKKEEVEKPKEEEKPKKKVVTRHPLEAYVDDCLKSRLGALADITVKIEDDTLKVHIKPKPGTEDFWIRFEDVELTMDLSRYSEKSLKSDTKLMQAICDDVYVMLFEGEFLHPLVVSSIDAGVLVHGSFREAASIFAFVCQQGSPYHCTVLGKFIQNILKHALQTKDKDLRTLYTEDLDAAGFPLITEFLNRLDISNISSKCLTALATALYAGILEELSKYAKTARDIKGLTREDIAKSWGALKKAIRAPLYMPKNFDECHILEGVIDVIVGYCMFDELEEIHKALEPVLEKCRRREVFSKPKQSQPSSKTEQKSQSKVKVEVKSEVEDVRKKLRGIYERYLKGG